MKTALVVPTCRPESLASFLDAWEPHRFWDSLIVVRDDPSPVDVPDASVYCYRDIEREMGNNHWVISYRDSAIRSFGFLKAWELGADLIVTLDDDCYPVEGQGDFAAGHRSTLDAMPRWASGVPGLVPRGLPYRNRGTTPRVMISQGLWRGVPDLDAPRSLVAGLPDDYTPPEGRWIMPAGQYQPICGMNLAFKREATPLLYFPKMGHDSPYRRFDDIWMGVLSRKLCDHLGWQIGAGRPWVHHRRASDVMTNLVKEAPGIARNETFWCDIEAVRLTEREPARAVAELGQALESHPDAYTARLGMALGIWARRLGA